MKCNHRGNIFEIDTNTDFVVCRPVVCTLRLESNIEFPKAGY